MSYLPKDTVEIEELKEVDGEIKLIPEKVSFDLHSDFTINDDDLEGEACKLGQLLVQYGDVYAKLKTQLTRQEEQLKQVAAITAQRIRKEAAENKEKVTENVVNERTLSDSYYVSFQGAVNRTRENYFRAESWWRSIQQKCDLVKMIGYRQKAEYTRL